MACSGNMLRAAANMPATTTPFAGGILAFAEYMNGKVDAGEATARKAIGNGFDDSWTIHAVAHCLYAQGKSSECAAFLDGYRSHIQDNCHPSAFMKGHMEFHQALCFMDLEQESNLENLINGPLWTGLSDSERQDYWNAAGLLNVHWKAELRGQKRTDTSTIHQAMAILQSSAMADKSAVFSLCILRWSTSSFRKEWKEQLSQSDDSVLLAMAQAVDMIYPCDNNTNDFGAFSEEHCGSAMKSYLTKISNNLEKLGASPEQREVLEEFVGVVAQKASKKGDGEVIIDWERWAGRNRRPHVPFYDTILGKQ